MKEIVTGKKVIIKNKAVFKAEELYKFIIKKIPELGYTYVEKEQRFKPTQYGDTSKYTILGFKIYDSFAKSGLEVSVKYEDMNKTKYEQKTMDEADISVQIKGTVTYDYNNNWEKSALSRFLFDIYLKYLKKNELKKKCIIPTSTVVGKLHKELKKHLELY